MSVRIQISRSSNIFLAKDAEVSLLMITFLIFYSICISFFVSNWPISNGDRRNSSKPYSFAFCYTSLFRCAELAMMRGSLQRLKALYFMNWYSFIISFFSFALVYSSLSGSIYSYNLYAATSSLIHQSSNYFLDSDSFE
jgi:hypothetical protein